MVITETYPEIEAWYHCPAKAQKFMVTAIDDHANTVEIQYFDGTIDEMEHDTWYLLDIERVETPEDWTGPIDNIEKDDLNPVGTEMQGRDWAEPYDEEGEKLRAGPVIPEDEEDYPEEDWEDDLPDIDMPYVDLPDEDLIEDDEELWQEEE